MKKKIYLFIVALPLVMHVKAQVGINNAVPAATLDVTAKTDATATTTAEGLIAPRLSRATLIAKDNAYTAPQAGTLLYVTDVTGTLTAKTANVTAAGYYYFDGTIWQKVTNGTGTNIYTADGTLAGNRIVTMGTNNLAWNSTATTTTTSNINANSLTTGRALDISTSALTTGTALNISSSNGTTNTNGIIKVANTSAPGGGTFATLQANSTAGSGLNILNNGNTGIAITNPGSTLDVKGSVATQYTAITATTYAVLDNDNYLSYSGNSATVFTLPAGSASITGREYIIRNSSTSAVSITVNVSGSTNIDVAGSGVASMSIPQGYSAFFKATGSSTGTTWLVTIISSSSTSRIVGNGLYRTTTAITYPYGGAISYNATSLTGYTIVPFGGSSGEITVPNDGSYQTSLRWWGASDAGSAAPANQTSAYFRLVKKDGVTNALTTLDEIEYYVHFDSTSGVITFTVNLLGTGLKAGDKLVVYIRPSVGGSNWRTGTAGTTTVFNPSLLVVQQ
jgi:hypothetical protein